MDVYGLDCLCSSVVRSSAFPVHFPLHFLLQILCTVTHAMGVGVLAVCIFFACEDFVVELQLDSEKPSQKESVRRTLFLDSQQPSLLVNVSLSDGGRSCHDAQIYLRVSHTGFFFCFVLFFAKLSN